MPMKSIRLSPLVVLTTLACAPGGAAEALRPEAPTASEALGESGPDDVECRDVTRGAEPLVVDWKPDKRGDLEVAMKEGIAVVSYGCDGIRLLDGCHIDGEYGFIGMTRKEQVVRLDSADEVHANLPLTGASIGGEMKRGVSLDIATVIVGKRRSAWDSPTRDDLAGSCDGATHYVRGATVGAFALSSASDAKVRAVAEIFAASAGTASSSSKSMSNREGDIADCKNATPDSKIPPPQCGAPVRLALMPIASPSPSAEKAPPAATTTVADAPACPAGLVFGAGKCTAPSNSVPHQCLVNDESGCQAQCDKGHAGSCAALGAILMRNGDSKAAAVLRGACDKGDAAACVNLGRLEARGTDAQKTGANQLFEKGCHGGIAAGCFALGTAHLTGAGGAKTDPARAFGLFNQACSGGDRGGCAAAASLLLEGKGVGKDVAEAGKLLGRACQAGDGASCTRLGLLQEARSVKPGGAIVAKTSYRRACYRFDAAGCAQLGRLVYETSPEQAKSHFSAACLRGSKLGCAVMVVAYGEKKTVIPDAKTTSALNKSCSGGAVADCVALGIIQVAGKVGTGKQRLGSACRRGDKFACAMEKKAK